jgi:predicted nuclease with TOPRIM domain
MKLREKRELQQELHAQIKKTNKVLRDLAEKRENLDHPNWQYYNAKYNMIYDKLTRLKNRLNRLDYKMKPIPATYRMPSAKCEIFN